MGWCEMQFRWGNSMLLKWGREGLNSLYFSLCRWHFNSSGGMLDNLWVSKPVLRRFELGSSLMLNCEKIYSASRFLNCNIGGITSKYLYLPIETNPRKMSKLKPVIDSMFRRHASWKGKHLSFRGWITLVNSIE